MKSIIFRTLNALIESIYLLLIWSLIVSIILLIITFVSFDVNYVKEQIDSKEMTFFFGATRFVASIVFLIVLLFVGRQNNYDQYVTEFNKMINKKKWNYVFKHIYNYFN